jgi:hypothetical protein
MGLFTRVFGATEKGETPASDETDQDSELAQWPYLTVPVQHDSGAPARTSSVPPPIPPPLPRNTNADAPGVRAEPARGAGTGRATAAAAQGVGAEPARRGAGTGRATAAATPSVGAESAQLGAETARATVDAPGVASAAARGPVNAVRALQTIIVRTPAPVASALAAPAGSEEIELVLDWSAPETPAPAIAQPAANDQADRLAKREPLLVHYLLRQVPDVHQLTIDKLRAAGYGSLDALCRSSAADLVTLGRIDAARANAIARRFRSYCRERSEPAREQVKPRLSALLERLARAHAEYERADAAEERAKKRSARNERRAASLELSLLLAQIGEIELVEGLERSPTERKIELVRRYLGRPPADSGAGRGERR